MFIFVTAALQDFKRKSDGTILLRLSKLLTVAFSIWMYFEIFLIFVQCFFNVSSASSSLKCICTHVELLHSWLPTDILRY